MIVFQNDDARTMVDRQKFCRRRNAITDRGNQRNAGGVGIDQSGGSSPCAFVLVVGEGSLEHPGRAFTSNRGAASLLSPERKRAVGGRIQVTNMAWHREQGAPRRKHC